MRMKIAYIAGPYRNGTWYETEANIVRARVVALEYWKKGYAVICPHTNSAHFEHVAPYDFVNPTNYLNGYLTILEKVDLVVVLRDWEKSQGTKAEIYKAETLGIEVIYE